MPSSKAANFGTLEADMQKEFKVSEEKGSWESFVAQHPDAVTKFDTDVWVVIYGLPAVITPDDSVDPAANKIREALMTTGKTDAQINALFELASTL